MSVENVRTADRRKRSGARDGGSRPGSTNVHDRPGVDSAPAIITVGMDSARGWCVCGVCGRGWRPEVRSGSPSSSACMLVKLSKAQRTSREERQFWTAAMNVPEASYSCRIKTPDTGHRRASRGRQSDYLTAWPASLLASMWTRGRRKSWRAEAQIQFCRAVLYHVVTQAS